MESLVSTTDENRCQEKDFFRIYEKRTIPLWAIKIPERATQGIPLKKFERKEK